MTHVNQIGPRLPPATTAPELGRRRTAEIVTGDLDVLVGCYNSLTRDRKLDFWQIPGTRADKILYLLRWGGIEQGKGIPLCE